MRTLRVVTLNLWNDREEPEARLRVAIDGLRALQPDVVCLQEAIADPGRHHQPAQLAQALDARWCFDAVDAGRPGGPCGNAIVSRFPIHDVGSIALPSADDDPRRALRCELATPFGRLPVFSCHLSWQMWLSPRREAQVVALDELVRAHPGELPPLVCGDFNASPDSDAIRFMTGRCSLLGRGTYYRDAFARRHPATDGDTWSDRNPHAVRWVERNRRIDYVFVGPMEPGGWGAVLEARVALDLPGHEGTFASDHFAVYAELGDADLASAR